MDGADVIVVGAGIVGAACALALADRGVRVTLLDRGTAGGGTTSHGEGNLLVSDKGPGAELVLAQRSAELWPDLGARAADELGPDFPSIEYDPKGGLVVATTRAGHEALERFAAGQRGAGVDARPVDHARIRALEPWLTPEVTGAVWYPEDAQVQPAIATDALVALARRAGVRLVEGCEVQGAIVRTDGRLGGVRTSRGGFRADAVVVAAGPWSGTVAASLGAPIPVAPRRGVVLVTARMPKRVHHKVYDADYVGAVGSGDATLQTSSVVESTESGTVLIGSSREQIGFDDRMRPAVLSQVAAKALRLFPFLATTAVMRSYSGFRPFMPDHLPVIGPDPRLDGLWHATGHEGAGIGLCLATGELLAERMTGTTPTTDPAPFDLDRPTLADRLGIAA
ncbi:FAD-binding oxidoreductase [Pseudoclavibacter chungangensis]|uniref:FAD-binding oxidoreductase n=2 Tax=Pseudoclavibacter chungangensis TaxID=587635 RepID=A0A7J5C166_9MICO|nr:FAD-binding oxidoreductase [Pseudoclavibacter chungangensis]